LEKQSKENIVRSLRLGLLMGLILAGAVFATGVEAKKPTEKKPSKAQLRKAKEQEALQTVVAAAEAGDPRSQMIAGLVLLEGKKLPQDRERGLKFLESAAEKGDTGATSALIEIFEKGKHGVPKDSARVEALYAKMGVASPAAIKAGYDALKPQVDAFMQSNDERAVFINKAKTLDKNSPIEELASAVVEGTRLMEKAHSQKTSPAPEVASSPANP
jgi:TPR repeat protein